MKNFDRYLELRDKLDCQLESDKCRLNKSLIELQNAIDIFSGKDEKNSLISFESLSGFEFDKWYDASNGVRFKRIKDDNKPVYFITEMTPNKSEDGVARFGIQEHDCKEVVQIVKGELIEPFEQYKKYSVKDTVIYPQNYKHKPYATVDSTYLVEFIK